MFLAFQNTFVHFDDNASLEKHQTVSTGNIAVETTYFMIKNNLQKKR